jgi:catechol 2,3-dioxygenase-like lactoylglutathione lyase family enzyme
MARIKHIAIATQNPEETARFYINVFDLEMVGKVDSDNAEGYYLSDGNVNIAVLRFKNEAVAGTEFGTEYVGIHHIGFQVEDATDADARLRKANSYPREDINTALNSHNGEGNGDRNVEMKYAGPDGVMIDISQGGWVGTGDA